MSKIDFLYWLKDYLKNHTEITSYIIKKEYDEILEKFKVVFDADTHNKYDNLPDYQKFFVPHLSHLDIDIFLFSIFLTLFNESLEKCNSSIKLFNEHLFKLLDWAIWSYEDLQAKKK